MSSSFWSDPLHGTFSQVIKVINLQNWYESLSNNCALNSKAYSRDEPENTRLDCNENYVCQNYTDWIAESKIHSGRAGKGKDNFALGNSIALPSGAYGWLVVVLIKWVFNQIFKSVFAIYEIYPVNN